MSAIAVTAGSMRYLASAGSRHELVKEGELWAMIGFAILLSTFMCGLTAPSVIARARAREEAPG